MANDVADWTSSVVIQSGSVTISGTASVSIVGTPTVSISGTPTVNVGNTPAVTISSGSVTANISGTPNINIQSQSVTVAVNSPPQALADLVFPINVTSTQTTGAVPSGTHALVLINAGANLLGSPVTVKGHTSGAQYFPSSSFTHGMGLNPHQVLVIPIPSVTDTQFDVTGTVGGVAVTVHVLALLDTEAVWVQNTFETPIYVKVSGPQGYAFAVQNNPGAGSRATISLAAQSGLSWICQSYTGEVAGSVAIAAVTLALRDGATGVGALLAGHVMSAVAGAMAQIERSNLHYIGTAGNQITLEFEAASASDFQSVNMGVFLSA